MLKSKIFTVIATLLLSATMIGAAHAKSFTVQIKGMAFSPNSLSVSAGDTIKFVNRDGAPHTATADDGSFDTGRLSKGQSKTIKISKAGSFGYFCGVHPSMKGKVTAQ